jgi:hypothetical protein
LRKTIFSSPTISFDLVVIINRSNGPPRLQGRGCAATAMQCGCSRGAATTGVAGIPRLSLTAMQPRASSFTLDGEGVVCGPDGIAVFDALHRRGTASEAMLYAFDLLALEGAWRASSRSG